MPSAFIGNTDWARAPRYYEAPLPSSFIMKSFPDPAARQRQSWSANAVAWTEAVRTRQIESRRLATDAAVLQAILTRSPTRVLDLGCGEGWLCRALSAHGIDVTGVDASGALIRAAQAEDSRTQYRKLSFRQITARPEQLGLAYDAVVFNFSLLDEDVEPILASASSLMSSTGVLVLQTVHPWSACGAEPYRSGWRIESFQNLGVSFPDPLPWYFRTLADWVETLGKAALELRELHEPCHPESRHPLSLLLVCTRARSHRGPPSW